MARIRSIHPGVYTDEAWASVSIAARWFAKGLCTEADDNGVFDWKPLQLKMRIFPADAVDVPALLAELVVADIVRAFDVDGKRYGAVRNFCRHQRPRKPKAWFPITEEVRAYVGYHDPKDDVEPVDDETVPKKSELTPVEVVPVPQRSEISPQMEDGGWRGKEEGDAKASLVRQADGPSVFEQAWLVYPSLGRERSFSKDKTRPIWRDAAKKAGGELRLLVAIQRFVRLDKTHKGEAGPAGFHRWLRDGKWEHWLEPEGEAAVQLHTFAEPAIRAAFVAHRDEAWVRAWIDPCEWRDWDRTIVPKTGVAAARILQEGRALLRTLNVTLQEKAA